MSSLILVLGSAMCSFAFGMWLLVPARPVPDAVPSVALAVPEVEPFVGPPPQDAATVELVEVKVPRELRGLWVATVSNLDFPTRTGLSATALRRELSTLVDGADKLGFNALVFQVRPEGDALYASKLEPWSRFLTGKQGRAPGIDPLEVLIELAHARGIEVHAWFNPYRAQSARGAPVADNHVSKWAKPYTRPWGKVLWLDPGAPPIQDHALAVVTDVLTRYDIDGVHLDDYFYPYPEGGRAFDDDASYKDYKQSGGVLARDEWRRGNVNSLVERIADTVHTKRPDVRFGISPFGIYRPGTPRGIRGMDQVAQLHADPLKWFGEGWVDYLAPQLYWPTTAKQQAYGTLLGWWDGQVDAERPLIVGLDLTKAGKDPKWTIAELRTQVELERAAANPGGQIWFRASQALANQGGVGDLLAELYRRPALPPPLPRLKEPPPPPTVAVDGHDLVLTVAEPKALRAVVLYKRTRSSGWEVQQVLGPATDRVAIATGTWAVSAVARSGAESQGVQVVVTDDAADGLAEP
ncbi:MAG: family 10 glycosylhydrolase [Myxococcota bacterium]